MKPKKNNVAQEQCSVGFSITESKDTGVFKGIASVFGSLVDAWIPTVFVPGAFTKTIKENGKRFRICYQHDADEPLARPGLGINPEDVLEESDLGLLVGGKISDTARGRDVQVLLKDKVIDELSIGWDPIEGKYELMPIQKAIDAGILKFPTQWMNKNPDDQCRVVREARLWEASFVTFAADRFAMVTEAHAVVPFQDLTLADESLAWSGAAAHNRLVADCGCDGDSPNWTKFKKAHLWFDDADAEKITSYKFQIADVVDGKLEAIPRGIFAAAAILQGARGGTKVPQADQDKMKTHLSRYYKKMDRTAPWDEEKDSLEFIVESLYSLGPDEIQEGKVLSKKNKQLLADAIAALSALVEAAEPPDDESASDTPAQGTSKQALTVDNEERFSRLNELQLWLVN